MSKFIILVDTFPLGLPFPLLVQQSHLDLVLPVHENQVKRKKSREYQCIFSFNRHEMKALAA